MVGLEDLQRAGRRRIDGPDRQRRGGVDVRAQHAVRQLEGPARRLRAGQRRDARGADEAVQAVGQVVQTRERLLHRGDPRTGDLEGDRASLAEPAVSRRDGPGRNRHRVRRARLERRDRAEDLVVTEVAPGPGGVRRQRGPRRARGRTAVEADRHPARAVAHTRERQVRERGPRSGPRRLKRRRPPKRRAPRLRAIVVPGGCAIAASASRVCNAPAALATSTADAAARIAVPTAAPTVAGRLVPCHFEPIRHSLSSRGPHADSQILVAARRNRRPIHCICNERPCRSPGPYGAAHRCAAISAARPAQS